MPSRYEGFSLSLIEGMSQGLIPIAYPVGVVPEIIKNGQNGFIVNNQKEAIICVENLLSKKDLREKMAAEAQQTSLNFRSDILVKQLVPFYEDVIKNSKKQ